VRGDLTLNSMTQIHTSVTLLTSRDLTWSSGRLTRQHASHISVVAHISWGVTNASSALHEGVNIKIYNKYGILTNWRRSHFLRKKQSNSRNWAGLSTVIPRVRKPTHLTWGWRVAALTSFHSSL